ncbi:MAG TPA: hypothetical protein PKV56_15545 [Burkholderiaceae bacterium]|jgi:hypothetical protein|nr:hypothetical protein [Piscinibacter sp.]HOX69274.1 hypothetical protein [Burkholderiaceae bacterium]
MQDNIEAATFGMFHAVQVAIRALIATHPDPSSLVQAFAAEHLESMSMLLASPFPDASIDAYKDFLRGCAPNADDWLEA